MARWHAMRMRRPIGSAANLDIHLQCLLLDGGYRRTGGEAVLQAARAPGRDASARLPDRRIARLLKPLTRQGYTDAVGTEVRGRVPARGPRE